MSGYSEPDYELYAQKAGEKALDDLFIEAEEGGCDCPTCIVREVLTAAWPHLNLLAQSEINRT